MKVVGTITIGEREIPIISKNYFDCEQAIAYAKFATKVWGTGGDFLDLDTFLKSLSLLTDGEKRGIENSIKKFSKMIWSVKDAFTKLKNRQSPFESISNITADLTTNKEEQEDLDSKIALYREMIAFFEEDGTIKKDLPVIKKRLIESYSEVSQELEVEDSNLAELIAEFNTRLNEVIIPQTEITIDDLDLREVACNKLKRAGFFDLDSLLNCTEKELSSRRYALGAEQINKIKEVLTLMGLELKHSYESPWENTKITIGDIHDPSHRQISGKSFAAKLYQRASLPGRILYSLVSNNVTAEQLIKGMWRNKRTIPGITITDLDVIERADRSLLSSSESYPRAQQDQRTTVSELTEFERKQIIKATTDICKKRLEAYQKRKAAIKKENSRLMDIKKTYKAYLLQSIDQGQDELAKLQEKNGVEHSGQ